MPFREARQQRIIRAVLENIQNWEDRLLDLEPRALPGNKHYILSLVRDMQFARRSLRRLSGMDDDPGTM